MSKGNDTTAKVDKEVVESMKQIKRKVEVTEGRDIAMSELLRRTFRSPVVEKILIEDAELKRRLGKK